MECLSVGCSEADEGSFCIKRVDVIRCLGEQFLVPLTVLVHPVGGTEFCEPLGVFEACRESSPFLPGHICVIQIRDL